MLDVLRIAEGRERGRKGGRVSAKARARYVVVTLADRSAVRQVVLNPKTVHTRRGRLLPRLELDSEGRKGLALPDFFRSRDGTSVRPLATA